MKKLALVKDVTDFWKVYEPMLKKYSIDVITLDIFNYENQQRLLNENWDGFFWRAKHDPRYRDLAKRFFPLFENELGIKTFPSFKDYWHYDDKMSQYFLFQKLNIPTPKTYVFYNQDEAINFINTKAEFPIIYKAPSGAGSANVGFLKSKFSAIRYIKKAFNKGIKTASLEDLQRYYVYFQEFLKYNDGDYRVISYGKDRIVSFFRANKPNQKFASGSGQINFADVPVEILQLVNETCSKLNFPNWMSFDIMKDNDGQWVVGEMSVINGDINSLEIYNKAKHYQVLNGEILPLDQPSDLLEYFVKSLLNEWGWID